MNTESITNRCRQVLEACLDDVLAEGRATDLAQRLDVLTKATRFLETVTPRVSYVRHTHDPEGTRDQLA